MEVKKEFEPQCAGWIKKTKKGDDYLSIKTPEGKWFNLFKNNKKQSGDKKPDWTEIRKKEDHNSNNEFGFEPNFGKSEDIPF